MCMENKTIGKWQLPFVCCKQKKETANFHLFFFKRKMEIRSLFSFAGRREKVINICCFIKHPIYGH